MALQFASYCIMHKICTIHIMSSSPPESATPQIKYGLLVVTLASAGITVSLAQTLVIPIIGRLPEIFNTTAVNASWIITVTLLVGAVATPVMGRLADMYGKKKMMLISLIPFVLGSVICAVSADLIPMIIGRGFQGLGSGLIPLGISLMHDLLPREKAGSAIALMSSSMGIGGALGLPLAAAIAQFASWRVLFWFTALVALTVGAVIWKAIPARPRIVRSGGFDYFGTLGLAMGIIALLLAVSKGSEWGWRSALTIGLFVAALVILVGWGWFETRQKSPLIDLRTTIRATVLMTNIASILIGFTMYGMNLILPQVMQLPVILGYGLGRVEQVVWWALGLGESPACGIAGLAAVTVVLLSWLRDGDLADESQ
ncbi:MFS transporter [Corynebacterium glutamicum]|nr:MFS transporter [Corynebacterium glutamicum]